MQTYETSGTVGGDGQVRVTGVPFAPGTPVEITIAPQRRTPADFVAAWQILCNQLRTQPTAELTDAEIDKEIGDFRAGR